MEIPRFENSIDESLKSCSITVLKKKTRESPYQPILNNLFLFLTITNTFIYPANHIFLCVCVCACVFVCLCMYVCMYVVVCLPVLLTLLSHLLTAQL